MKNNNLSYLDSKYSVSNQTNETSVNVGDVLSISWLKSLTSQKKENIVGICIAKRNSGEKSSVTVRNIIAGEGIEYTVPLHSPLLESIKILGQRKVRRSRLNYLRDKSTKLSKIKS